MSSRAALVFLLVSFAWCSSTYAGTMYLVGAHIYRTDATGAYSDDPFPAYTYSTNALTRHSPLYLNGSVTGLDASFELLLGSNTFTFAGLPPLNPGGFIGLNLFFSPNSTPFNAVPGSVVPGDITLFTATNGLNGNVTNAGTSILSYGVDNFDAPLALANGKSALVLGDRMVGVSAFTSNTSPSGSFTLTVTSVPEPSSAIVVLSVIPFVLCFRLQRRSGGSLVRPLQNQAAQFPLS